MVKINFSTKGKEAAEPPADRPQSPPRTSSVSLKLKLGSAASPITETSGTAIGNSPIVKPKRKYTKKPKIDQDGITTSPEVTKGGKKRARKDDEKDELEAPFKRPATAERSQSITLKLNDSSSSRGVQPKPKLKIPGRPAFGPSKISFKQQSATTPRLKVKALGKPPDRPLGVGYDSEGEGIEEDPAVETHFVLRMQPGDDCDYLRKAIADSHVRQKGDEKRIGPDVWMRFFDKNGRRGVVSVRGNLYAAALLDLPCVVEVMKSWDKRGFFKTADICQLLLVLGPVKDEDEAKRLPLPSEVDDKNYQYPHGLTPPMHHVRKRRFRKRINVRTIERAENDVEELFKKDQACKDLGGTVKFEWVDPEQDEDEDGDVMDEYGYTNTNGANEGDEDAEGEDGMDINTGAEGAEIDVDVLEQMFEDEFTKDQVDQEDHTVALDPGMLHASPDVLLPPDSVQTPGSQEGPSATEVESDDEEEDEETVETPELEEEEGEAEIARRQERETQLEELKDIRDGITAAEEKWKKQVNPLLKNRALQDVKSLKEELQLKLSSLGLAEDDD